VLRRRPSQLRVVPGSDRAQPEVHHHGAVEQKRVRVAQEREEAQGREEQEPGQVGVVRLQVGVPGCRQVLDGTLSLRDIPSYLYLFTLFTCAHTYLVLRYHNIMSCFIYLLLFFFAPRKYFYNMRCLSLILDFYLAVIIIWLLNPLPVCVT